MTDPACLTRGQVAARLGISMSTFYSRRSRLEAEGFPKVDPVLDRYLSEDVEAWLKKRRQIRDDDPPQKTRKEAHYGAL